MSGGGPPGGWGQTSRGETGTSGRRVVGRLDGEVEMGWPPWTVEPGRWDETTPPKSSVVSPPQQDG